MNSLTRTSLLKIICLAIALFLLYLFLDFIWFEVMGNFFKGEISSIARLNAAGHWDVGVGAAFLVYVFMTLGIGIFVLHHSGSYQEVAIYGALFGLITYGIYDFTNLSTLAAWTYRFALVDILWGTVMNASVAVSAKWLIPKIDELFVD